MISFAKKSYFTQKEVLEILGEKPRGIRSFFSENGKKLYLREDIIRLYAESTVEKEVDVHNEKLRQAKDKCQSVIGLIHLMRENHPDYWSKSQ